MERVIVKNPALFVWAKFVPCLARDLSERYAKRTAYPPREMTLIGKASASGDFGKARIPLAQELDGALQSKMHDIAMRRDTDRACKYACEMKRAATRNTRQRGNIDGLVEIVPHIIPKPPHHVVAQHSPGPALNFPRCVSGDYAIEEAA
jgi:hypothetical protein